jgi:transcriptional regulator GlxA family with amidase domain
LQHLHQEGFDATALSREMAMSRAQLFRKLKPIISQPPASYIKAIRLQKAKELLETSDLTVSEVAYKTGFKTPSHFTKVFTEKFGLRPSVFATATVHATNE